ncbi:MAG: GNAT family N-acetyltransferase [Clostridiales bacterium]|nr:GNAT family N-acetyltransferase [Clostridiales bacterium]
MDITIRKAETAEAEALAALAAQLWEDDDPEELLNGFRGLLLRDDAACFILFASGRPKAFAQCQLRHDYVEGTESSPVGYLEGIFVSEEYRKQGCAARLLAECENWATQKGCSEFASDCELDNRDSLKFHLAMGFEEANRIICFRKAL